MIAVLDAPLDGQLSTKLQGLQDRISQLDNYAAQVAFAKSSWATKPAALFGELKERLAALCSGNRRCVYCEDSLADEIEHMRPKDLYPEQAYVWRNYVLACGPCNGPKNNRFAILDGTDALIDVTRRRGAVLAPPQQGRHALIDPRIEDPISLLWLDFRTWRYVPDSDDDNSIAWRRAEYTIDVLRLNKRDDLVRGRRAAFSGFEARLRMWIEHREQWDVARRQAFVTDFRVERFRGVWERMKRHHAQTPLLQEVSVLFDAAPEAAAW
jgi:uncharacterized protein (TIGR02646 family)